MVKGETTVDDDDEEEKGGSVGAGGRDGCEIGGDSEEAEEVGVP